MIRAVLYAAVVLAFAAAVNWRGGVAEAELGREVVSIAGEWKKHGKPVDLSPAGSGAVVRIVKVSGIAGDGGTVRVDAPPKTAAELKAGQPFYDCGAGRLSGSVESVAGTPDVVTGLRRASLRLRRGRVPSGAVLTACVRVSSAWTGVRIPRKAVLRENGDVFVWVVRDGKAVKRAVSLGPEDERFSSVRSGLVKGDLVVTAGRHALEEGDRVRPRDPEGPR